MRWQALKWSEVTTVRPAMLRTKKKYGPTYQQVALKYADEAGAAEKLAKKIQTGGAGVWGNTPMPAQPRVSDEDALAIARYILSVK